jgi:DNA repair protein RecO (recombination protein O)
MGRRSNRLYRTEAIVLRRQDLGEADRILTLYTLHHGKVKAIVKGARKPLSRKAGHLELFARADLQIARGHDLDIISQAEMLEAYTTLRTDLKRMAYAAYFVELIDSFTGERDENRLLYSLLAEGLGWICESTHLLRTAQYYELQLLALSGYSPQLDVCVGCGRELHPEQQFFSHTEGGALCPACGNGRPGARSLSLAALKVLRHMQRSPYATITGLKLRPLTLRETGKLLGSLIAYHLEYRPRSLAFIQRLRRELRRDSLDG